MIVVAIIKIGTGLQPVAQFRYAEDEEAAVNAFCTESTVNAKPVEDYLGVDTGLAFGAVELGSPWVYDFDTSTLLEDLLRVQDALVVLLKEYRMVKESQGETDLQPGIQFSTSPNSQSRWQGLLDLDGLGRVDYPFRVSTNDERDFWDLLGRADLRDGLLGMAGAVLVERALCGTSIAAVLAATDVATARAAAAVYLAT